MKSKKRKEEEEGTWASCCGARPEAKERTRKQQHDETQRIETRGKRQRTEPKGRKLGATRHGKRTGKGERKRNGTKRRREDTRKRRRQTKKEGIIFFPSLFFSFSFLFFSFFSFFLFFSFLSCLLFFSLFVFFFHSFSFLSCIFLSLLLKNSFPLFWLAFFLFFLLRFSLSPSLPLPFLLFVSPLLWRFLLFSSLLDYLVDVVRVSLRMRCSALIKMQLNVARDRFKVLRKYAHDHCQNDVPAKGKGRQLLTKPHRNLLQSQVDAALSDHFRFGLVLYAKLHIFCYAFFLAPSLPLLPFLPLSYSCFVCFSCSFAIYPDCSPLRALFLLPVSMVLLSFIILWMLFGLFSSSSFPSSWFTQITFTKWWRGAQYTDQLTVPTSTTCPLHTPSKVLPRALAAGSVNPPLPGLPPAPSSCCSILFSPCTNTPATSSSCSPTFPLPHRDVTQPVPHPAASSATSPSPIPQPAPAPAAAALPPPAAAALPPPPPAPLTHQVRPPLLLHQQLAPAIHAALHVEPPHHASPAHSLVSGPVTRSATRNAEASTLPRILVCSGMILRACSILPLILFFLISFLVYFPSSNFAFLVWFSFTVIFLISVLLSQCFFLDEADTLVQLGYTNLCYTVPAHVYHTFSFRAFRLIRSSKCMGHLILFLLSDSLFLWFSDSLFPCPDRRIWSIGWIHTPPSSCEAFFSGINWRPHPFLSSTPLSSLRWHRHRLHRDSAAVCGSPTSHQHGNVSSGTLPSWYPFSQRRTVTSRQPGRDCIAYYRRPAIEPRPGCALFAQCDVLRDHFPHSPQLFFFSLTQLSPLFQPFLLDSFFMLDKIFNNTVCESVSFSVWAVCHLLCSDSVLSVVFPFPSYCRILFQIEQEESNKEMKRDAKRRGQEKGRGRKGEGRGEEERKRARQMERDMNQREEQTERKRE